MHKPLPGKAGALLSMLMVWGLMIAPAAGAAVSEDQARRSIEQQYGVRVLKVEKTIFHDKPVYVLTVMTPGGNSNSAFQVNRLAVDSETGKLVSGFRHLPSGTSDAEGARSFETNRQADDALSRGKVWR